MSHFQRKLGGLGQIYCRVEASLERWMDYLKARNKTSHLYNETVANEVFSIVKSFIDDASELLKALEAEVR